MARRADVIMLGCTHYPFVRPLIADVVGADVALIDTGAAVAKRVRHVLANAICSTTPLHQERHCFGPAARLPPPSA